MSDQPTEPSVNNQMFLIGGISGTGKSASLRNIRNQKRWLYLNCEAGKQLPFKNEFNEFRITDPYEVFDYVDAAIEEPECEGIVIDTLTFLMDLFESKYVIGSKNTMQGWSDYQQYFKELMQQKLVLFERPVIIIAHVKEVYDEKALQFKSSVPVKGALQNNGIEAYFSTVVATKKVELDDLKPYATDKNELLEITEDDEIVGYKHVFQTRITKQTTGERIRSPMGLFTRDQTFMDNDAQLLLDYMKNYYGG